MKGITLRGLEVFEALAKTGSVAQTAQRLGLSLPAVSQQMRNLEIALGVDLIDHGKRPMELTAAGRRYLPSAELSLQTLRRAHSEVTVMDLSHLTTLGLGMIDDFENSLTPRLATLLAQSMVNCRFRMITNHSHSLIEALTSGQLDIAITAHNGDNIQDLVEIPLVRDPFVMVTPKSYGAADLTMDRLIEQPFLRYDRPQLIARQIEAHLSRHKVNLPARFEIGAHLALMALVAQGAGWAITTALGYMRAARFHTDVAVHPLPLRPFARQVSVLTQRDMAGHVAQDIAQTMGRMIQADMIDPCLTDVPWLADDLRIFPE